MKIVNVLKLKEEFDYESLCHKLWSQIDHLTAETERQESLRAAEKFILEKQLKDHCSSFSEREKDLIKRSEVVDSTTILTLGFIHNYPNFLGLPFSYTFFNWSVCFWKHSLCKDACTFPSLMIFIHFQLLEMEKNRLESEMKEILSDLNHQKDHNGLMHETVLELQVNLNYSKVLLCLELQ